MSNVFDLDSLREKLDNEFAPVKFTKGGEEFVLRNLLRVGKKDRTSIMTLMKEMSDIQAKEEETDVEDPESVERLQDILANVLALVTADGKGSKLVDKIGDDLQLLSKVMELWQEATSPGEAEDSPS